MKSNLTSDKSKPPRLGMLLLGSILSGGVRKNALGDIQEEYRTRAGLKNDKAARRWLWFEVIGVLGNSLRWFLASRELLTIRSVVSLVFLCSLTVLMFWPNDNGRNQWNTLPGSTDSSITVSKKPTRFDVRSASQPANPQMNESSRRVPIRLMARHDIDIVDGPLQPGTDLLAFKEPLAVEARSASQLADIQTNESISGLRERTTTRGLQSVPSTPTKNLSPDNTASLTAALTEPQSLEGRSASAYQPASETFEPAVKPSEQTPDTKDPQTVPSKSTKSGSPFAIYLTAASDTVLVGDHLFHVSPNGEFYGWKLPADEARRRRSEYESSGKLYPSPPAIFSRIAQRDFEAKKLSQ